MIMILVNRHTFNWSANVLTWVSKCMWPHIERQQGIAFLCALWFIMGGQRTLYYPKSTYSSLTCPSLFFFNKYSRKLCSLSGRGAGTLAVHRSIGSFLIDAFNSSSWSAIISRKCWELCRLWESRLIVIVLCLQLNRAAPVGDPKHFQPYRQYNPICSN